MHNSLHGFRQGLRRFEVSLPHWQAIALASLTVLVALWCLLAWLVALWCLLAWLDALRELVSAGPDNAVVCGDMNIAPTDADVFDPDAYIGQTHVTAPERAALASLQALGLRDVMRDRWPTQRVFTYWDYRAGMAALRSRRITARLRSPV